MTPVYGLLQQMALAYGPKDESVMVVDEHAQGIGGKRALLADVWIAMLHDCAVKVYRDGCHVLWGYFLIESSFTSP